MNAGRNCQLSTWKILYSSARNYCGLPGLIDVILVDPMVQ